MEIRNELQGFFDRHVIGLPRQKRECIDLVMHERAIWTGSKKRGPGVTNIRFNGPAGAGKTRLAMVLGAALERYAGYSGGGWLDFLEGRADSAAGEISVVGTPGQTAHALEKAFITDRPVIFFDECHAVRDKTPTCNLLLKIVAVEGHGIHHRLPFGKNDIVLAKACADVIFLWASNHTMSSVALESRAGSGGVIDVPAYSQAEKEELFAFFAASFHLSQTPTANAISHLVERCLGTGRAVKDLVVALTKIEPAVRSVADATEFTKTVRPRWSGGLERKHIRALQFLATRKAAGARESEIAAHASHPDERVVELGVKKLMEEMNVVSPEMVLPIGGKAWQIGTDGTAYLAALAAKKKAPAPVPASTPSIPAPTLADVHRPKIITPPVIKIGESKPTESIHDKIARQNALIAAGK